MIEIINKDAIAFHDNLIKCANYLTLQTKCCEGDDQSVFLISHPNQILLGVLYFKIKDNKCA